MRLDDGGGVLSISAPTVAAKRWISSKYVGVIKDTLEEMRLRAVDIRWTTEQSDKLNDGADRQGRTIELSTPSIAPSRNNGAFSQMLDGVSYINTPAETSLNQN